MDATIGDVSDARVWRRGEWTAKVVRSEEEDGWAVQMLRDGDPEPALVGPWTMGRDKKNPKPLDQAAFTALVKTANEVLARAAHQAAARLKREWTWRRDDGQTVRVTLTVVPDEDDPRAHLACEDAFTGEPLRSGPVGPGFRLTAASVDRFLRTGE